MIWGPQNHVEMGLLPVTSWKHGHQQMPDEEPQGRARSFLSPGSDCGLEEESWSRAVKITMVGTGAAPKGEASVLGGEDSGEGVLPPPVAGARASPWTDAFKPHLQHLRAPSGKLPHYSGPLCVLTEDRREP